MFLLITRRQLITTLSILLGFVSISVCTLAMHPRLPEWKEQKVVITEVKTDVRAVALTFDDGPNPRVTPQLLDILAEHGARATFFVIGAYAEAHPELVKRIAREGHEIGNHGYSHRIAQYKNQEYAASDVRTANRVIRSITGQSPTLIRPPGGFLSEKFVSFCQQENMQIVTWTWQQDSKDWAGVGSAQIAHSVLSKLAPGQIIILHDGGKNAKDVIKAVDMILDGAGKEGYQMVTVSELIAMAR